MRNFEWLNKDSRTFLSRGYLKEGQTAEEKMDLIANAAEKYLKLSGFANKFLDYLSYGWFSLASPVWSNFGEERGLPISCNGQYIMDSLDDILSCNAEAGMMTKNGAGTSAYFGDLRPRGSQISVGGESFGAVHFMQLFDKTTQIVSQSNVRRGSFAAYYPVEGADIDEFLNIREDGNAIQDISIGVTITDKWMEEMEAGDKSKRQLWAKIIKKRFETGYPYIMFSDTVNNNAPQVYKDKKIKIHASNLCVTGDQRVVSNYGLLTAKELFEIDKPLVLFDGEKSVNSSPMRLIDSYADVYKITLENGLTHTVTDYHKVVVYNQNLNDSEYKECKDLVNGDLVKYQSKKGIFGNNQMEKQAYSVGLNYMTEKELEKIYNLDSGDYCIVNELSIVPMLDLASVPKWVWNGTESTQWSYVKGLFEKVGKIEMTDNQFKLFLDSTFEEYLKEVQLLLLNLGLLFEFKSDNNYYSLICTSKSSGLIFDQNTGFLSKRKISLNNIEENNNEFNYSKVKSIDYLGKEPVYCVAVDTDEHLWVCNGFITHNCSEIALSSDNENSFVCDLASMNLLHYDDWKNTDAVQVLTYFLDAVMSEYIIKTENIPYMEKARNFAINQRALGIGGLGWHSYLQSKMIPFESLEAKILNTQIWQFIRAKAEEASKEMAIRYGEPPLLEGYSMRNVCLLAIAPTTSSSFILGQVSPSIEPLDANYFVKDLAKGRFSYKNPFLVELLKKYNKNNKEVWDNILKHGGSVAQLDFLTEHEKMVFKTFDEISQKEIVIQAAARQKYIDQSQSLNFKIHPKTPVKQVNELLLFAWKSGIKTLYYQRGTNPAQELARNILNCVSCEA